jgi:hypothetical protein|tara:strand:- start:3683 stop:3877 length:195 start_codon:yes stop_codon:yes gene_type:complete
MWNAIAAIFGLARDTLKRVFKTKHARQWKSNEEDIDNALADRDVVSLSSIFNKLRRKGSSSGKR